MESKTGQTTRPGSLLKVLDLLSNVLPKRRKIHNYTHYQMGVDYVFEAINHGTKGYMTAQGKGIRQGDRLLLRCEDGCVEYQVEEINYYSNPSNVWVALLLKIQ